jgi:hypothetical protein
VIRANVSSGNTGAIGDIIKKSFKSFAKGELVDGISAIINGGLDLLFNNYNGSVAKREL